MLEDFSCYVTIKNSSNFRLTGVNWSCSSGDKKDGHATGTFSSGAIEKIRAGLEPESEFICTLHKEASSIPIPIPPSKTEGAEGWLTLLTEDSAAIVLYFLCPYEGHNDVSVKKRNSDLDVSFWAISDKKLLGEKEWEHYLSPHTKNQTPTSHHPLSIYFQIGQRD